jgi:hypothetical protein
MNSLRKLVATLGVMAGILGILAALFVRDWIALTPDITAEPEPSSGGRLVIGVVGGVICVLAALAIWRAPRLSGLALAVGALALVQGLGYTPFTMLPIGFAAVAAGLALMVRFTGED